ncbi:PH domain-containing protein [Clostridium oryzae]|uniref:YdbS-like PH domain-containing protein n=1 Tax=Clostridium oryzae TaxID=1450648 RepID=A0A1V4IRM2_9CLOT|nr:PH domain-containing protein [Clostridium oryzae]OPJ62445.1 hypothetical protein CLORY_18140 [Clostridium oryzae]
MEKNKVVIKGAFKGITADFTKYILTLLALFIIYIISTAFKNGIYSKKNVGSLISYFKKFDLKDIGGMLSIGIIILIYIILIILAVSTIVRLFLLLYEAGHVIVIDYSSGKIVTKTYSFPLERTITEEKFNEIINVDIKQNMFQRFFNTGYMYIEFIALNQVDSQLRSVEIPYAFKPFLQKNKIL